MRMSTEKKAVDLKKETDFVEKIVHINRCAKVVKGGRRFSFAVLLVVGNKKGKVGVGLGKADEVPEAIRKAQQQARKSLMTIPMENTTIPEEVIGKFGSAKVLLKPAVAGTGLIAGAAVRAILECAGVPDVLTKSLGANNPHNVLKATIEAIKQLRSRQQYAEVRGKKVEEI